MRSERTQVIEVITGLEFDPTATHLFGSRQL
jgi:hypothetical protein